MSFLKQSDISRNYSTNLPDTIGFNGTIGIEGQSRPIELENGHHLATDEENEDTIRYEHAIEDSGFQQNFVAKAYSDGASERTWTNHSG